MTNSPQPAPAATGKPADAATLGSRLSRRGDHAHDAMLARVLPESGVSRLDVAAFNSSI